ncbi:bifunctional 4-hydroxy-2-oxoglutarate aldolase/2-dehydro-3-deoxy-phosphogluconate aldolase [Mycobacterium sp. Y57]|uniref:bifunctional 4-hydroxy-2-oxoglutarate aldolase/2-dehydro-3-deoxy-phosphogluconate aldolase n=1 Tax=Mycolicibacterium xanthum TaxID=2796469 RepID=UPI001C844D98|nr:bifunctional 4-hydroxy-2-oxoglutarate aldolase/2-dehydro-3-deoxy-phosphogluconate aldolase [Mycolicibacterium xanthum]MBX7434108.1 bifunctional 4-hydroxy-2-oxoglutarate aldolase/2-dehydro-3-deoxy-phosphogluconate aldolase [Mycolicibacterium xanthum]
MREPRSLLDVAPVMPVISVRNAADAVPAARAIAQAGLSLVQVALDGPGSFEAIERIAAEAPKIVVGAGALTDVTQPALARAAGAEFLVANTASAALREAMRATELPHLPGAASAVEAIDLLEDGYTDLVLFPAAAAGGLRHLKALAAFVPGARFCAVGGIGPVDLTGYLAAPNVRCVSADWLTPADAVRRRDWDRIRRLADVAVKLSRPTVTAVRAL